MTDPTLTPRTVPVAEVTAVKPGRDYYQVTVRCPYCARTHVHGWSGTGPIGSRVAHCDDLALERASRRAGHTIRKGNYDIGAAPTPETTT